MFDVSTVILDQPDEVRLWQAVCENATLAMFIMNDRQRCIYMNPAAEQLTGFTLAETMGRALHDVIHHTRPDGSPYPLEECPIDRAFPENAREQGEEVFVHKDGSFYPVAFTASPLRGSDRQVVGTIIEVRPIAAERAREAELRNLIDELNHRVKNTLMTVQALARQSLRPGQEVLAAREAFLDRLHALSNAHNVITEENWRATDIARLLTQSLKPFGFDVDGGPIRFSGPHLKIGARQAQSLAMALHELATNATKYGALSIPGGKVRIEWRHEEEAEYPFRFIWTETGGPATQSPERQGFGLKMLKQILAADLSGEVTVDFPPTGLIFEARGHIE